MTRNRALIDVDALTELFPHRVARATDLVALGFDSRSIHGNCQPGGPWQRIAPGVILLGNGPPTRSQLVASALSHAGSGAVLTGWDALHRHGISVPPGPGAVYLLIPPNRMARPIRHALIERTTNLPEPLLCQGFPIAPLPRAAIDTARRIESPDLLRALFNEVIQRGGVTPARLRQELDSASSRGTALPRQLLQEATTRIRSIAEVWARNLIKLAGLPQPQWNCPIRAPDGALLGIIDAWWDDVGLAWELHSYQFHPTPATHVETLRRNAQLTAAGIIVLHTHPTHLRDDPTTVADELRRAHQHAAQRPRPPVISEVAGAS
jgi:hypothetical protein